MKTHIINVQRYDTLESTLDKMVWGQSERILLVLPGRGNNFNRQFELKRLLRHSQTLGAELALVSREDDVHFFAAQLGIPTFRSMRKARLSDWEAGTVGNGFPEAPERPHSISDLRQALAAEPLSEQRLNSPAARLAFFILGVLAFLAVAAVMLPSATITLQPRTETQEISLEARANPNLSTYTLSGGLPAQTLRVVVEGRDSLASSGTVAIPQASATGTVTFTNLTDQAVTIPQDTIVRTLNNPPVRFATTRAGSLPAQAGETIDIPVQALNPGEDGNLPAESLVTVDGQLGLSVAVSNPEATRGGTQSSSTAPSEADYAQLKQILLASLAASALEEVNVGLESGDLIVSEPKLLEIVEETFVPAEPQPALELVLTLRAEFEVLVVPGDALQRMAAAALDANIPDGFVPLESGLQIVPLSEPVLDEQGNTTWELYASRNIQTQLTESQAVSMTVGVSPEEAQHRLTEQLPLEAAQISLFPGWWPRLPILPFRINVTIE
ncbi:MAG: baseplate J/gp47 family protein [Anaerolineales bacterium]|nr:baseplate J/gp47 family protein [Anaerolineales bacterium]